MSVLAARKAVRSLRVGIVPSSHVLDITVGIESVRDMIDRQVDEAAHGRQKSAVVTGEWGTGKSNLLSYLREYVIRQGMAVAYLNLNGYNAAINHPQRFYHRIIMTLRVSGAINGGFYQILAAAKSSPWVSANKYHSELAWAISQFFDGDQQAAVKILWGTDLYWSDYGYKKQKAITRINDLGAYLKSVGFKGMMVEFDELETVGQLWNSASRQSAYKILKQILDLRHVWSVFAATEKVNRVLVWDREWKLRDGIAKTFVDDYLKLPVLKTPGLDQRDARELVGRLETLYRRAYPTTPSIELRPILDHWNRMAISNHRRLIRYTIDYFDRHRSLPLLEDLERMTPTQHGLLTKYNVNTCSAKNGRLLVIAKDKHFLALLLEYLSDQGFVIKVLRSYERLDDIYSELSSESYDAVIATNSGLAAHLIPDAVAGIRQRFPKLPIVALSGWNPPAFIYRLKKEGIDHFLPMPFKKEDLKRCLKGAIKS
jgi:hypothetical protein